MVTVNGPSTITFRAQKVTVEVTYYGQNISPYDPVFEAGGIVPYTVSYEGYQDSEVWTYVFSYPENTSTSSRAIQVLFRDPLAGESTWYCTQAATSTSPEVDVITPDKSIGFGANTFGVDVRYLNVSKSAQISTPVPSANWLRTSRISFVTSSAGSTGSYLVQVAANSGSPYTARSASIAFKAGTSSDIFSVTQSGYPAIVSDPTASVAPAEDSSEEGTYYYFTVTYYNLTNSASVGPVTSSSAAIGSQRLAKRYSGGNYVEDWKVWVSDNQSPSPVTHSLTFTRNDQQTVYTGSYKVYQEAGSGISVSPSYKNVTYENTVFDVTASYVNISTIYGPTWNNSQGVTDITQIGSKTLGNVTEVYYRVSVSENAESSPRTTTVLFRGDDKQGSMMIEQDRGPSISIDPSEGEFAKEGSIRTTTITTEYFSGTVTATSDQSWITVSVSGNTGTIEVDANLSASSRVGTVTFAAGPAKATYTVTQKGYNPTLSISPTGSTFSANEESKTALVSYSDLWESISLSKDQSWITASLSGNTLTIQVSSNTSYNFSRTGSVTLSSSGKTATYKVKQNPISYVELGSQTENPINAPAVDKTQEGLYYTGSVLYVNDLDPSNIGSPTANVDWIHFRPTGSISSTATTMIQDYVVYLDDNEGYAPRTGSITFRLTGGRPSSCTWTFNQAGNKSSEANPSLFNIDWHSFTGSITVTYSGVSSEDIFGPSYSNDWVTVTETSRRTSGNNILVSYEVSVQQNDGFPRNKVIQFTAQGLDRVGSLFISQEGHSWVRLSDQTENPIIAPAIDKTEEGLYYSGSVRYMYDLNPEHIRPYVVTEPWIHFSLSGSLGTSSVAMYQDCTFYIDDNRNQEARSGSIIFGLEGGDPDTVEWKVIQKGYRYAEASPSLFELDWHEHSETTVVRYYNIPPGDIFGPSYVHEGLTVTELSRVESGVDTLVTYRLDIEQNNGNHRNYTIRFRAVDLDDEGSVFISQDGHRWVEVTEPTEPLIVEARDASEEGKWFPIRVVYHNTVDQNDILPYETNFEAGMLHFRSGSIKSSSVGFVQELELGVDTNADWHPRTGSVVFRMRDADPDTGSVWIYQKGAIALEAYPLEFRVPSNRIVYPATMEYPLTVVWHNMEQDTWMASASTSPDDLKIKEVSRSIDVDETGTRTITTYYDLTVEQNKGGTRQMNEWYYAGTGDERQSIYTVVIQAADKKIYIKQPQDQPITVPALDTTEEGLYYPIEVWYYFAEEGDIGAVTISDPTHFHLLDKGKTVEGNITKQLYSLYVDDNPGYSSRNGLITFHMNEVESKSVAIHQLGRTGIVAEPPRVLTTQKGTLFLEGVTYYNIPSQSILTPVTSSDRIQMEGKLGYPVENNYVEIHTIRIPENQETGPWTGSVVFAAEGNSYTASVQLSQGGKASIVLNPKVVEAPYVGLTEFPITASYHSYIGTNVREPVSSSSDVFLTFVTRSEETGSIGEPLVVDNYLLTVQPNAGTEEGIAHWIDFRALDYSARLPIFQSVSASIDVDPVKSFVRKEGTGSLGFRVTYLGINDPTGAAEMIVSGTVEPFYELTTLGTSASFDRVVVDYNLDVFPNEEDDSREHKFIFSYVTGSYATGSFTLKQRGATSILVHPETERVGKEGLAYSVEVTYRDYSEEETIKVPTSPASVDVRETYRRVTNDNLIVDYSINVQPNPGTYRTLTVGFEREADAAVHTIIQAGEIDEDKVRILSSNPLSVPVGTSTQSILVQYATDVQDNIQTPIFTGGVTLIGTEVLSNIGGQYVIKYTVSIPENNTGTRRTMTGRFNLLEGGFSYETLLTINQASTQAISLLYSTAPAWIENMLTVVDTDSTNLRVSLENVGQIYSKTVYRAPNERNINVDINRILESYVGASELSPGGVTRQALVATVETSQDSAEVGIINDWSYKLRDNYNILSNPINEVVALGQYFPISLFCPDNSAVSVSVRKPTGESTTYSVSGKYNIKDVMIPIDTCGTWTINGKTYETVTSKYVLYYYNKFGGWDSLPVTGVVVPEHEYERNTVGIKRLTTLDYNVLGTKKYELRTGILGDEQSQEIDNLVGSVKLYLQDTSNSVLIPVRAVDGSVQLKTYKNQGRTFPTYSFNVQEIETRKRK